MNTIVKVLLQLLAVAVVFIALVTFLGPSLGAVEISVLMLITLAVAVWLCWRAWHSSRHTVA